MTKLSDLFNLVAEEKLRVEERSKREQEAMGMLNAFIGQLQEVKKEEITETDVVLSEEVVIETIQEIVQPIVEAKKPEPPKDPLVPLDQKFVTKEEFQKHYTTFITRLQQQMSSLGGGGEVWFRWLDDVNRGTMTDSNDNWVLEYDAASKKVQFTKDIGPIDSVQFDTSHVDDNHPEGTLCWNQFDSTLNLTHANGVKQQIGQEQYYLVRNATGSTIPNGTVCMFAGAETFNGSRLLTAPFIADGTYPSLYSMGVATQDIADGAEGFVTSFGRVGDMDTTAWSLGDILYADPSTPGGLTNVKPTSPNNVSVIAAVVKVDATDGQIFVRPTIEQKMLYGRFASTVTQIPLAINTPYALDFNISEVERGFHRDGGGLPTSAITAEESGYYSASAIISLTSTNSSAKAFYVWLRKNGVDVPLSARRQSVTGNGTYQSMIYRTTLTMNKNDYFQIMYAASDTTIQIDSPSATAFCPAVPAATLLVTQVAL